MNQEQGGAALEHRIDDDTSVKVVGYVGRRRIEQYLALAGTLPASSGGVVDLDRAFGGVSMKLERRAGSATRRSSPPSAPTTTCRTSSVAAT